MGILSPFISFPLQVRVSVNGAVVVEEPVGQLRDLWEETSFQLDLLQAEPHCVTQEKQGLKERTGPSYCLPPTFPVASVPRNPSKCVCRGGVLGPTPGKVSGVLSGWVVYGDVSSSWPHLPSGYFARRGQ